MPTSDPLVPGTDAIGTAFVLFFLTAYHDDVRLDPVVAGEGGTGIAPFAPDLDVLVQREFGLGHGILFFCLILRKFPSDPISNVEKSG